MRRISFLLLKTLVTAALIGGCASTGSRPAGDSHGDQALRTRVGVASYVSSDLHGRRTASGDLYDERRMTAAHRTLEFGTRVRVTNLTTRQSVVVTITDRGPFWKGRIIDVSKRAAKELGFLTAGTARVRLDVLRN